MDTSHRPLTSKQRKELEGYISRSTAALRAFLFFIAAWLIAKSFKFIHHLVMGSFPPVSSDLFWIVPSFLIVWLLYVKSGQWTGGGEFRARVKADLAKGESVAYKVEALEAVEVEEREDEGPSYYIKTAGGATLLMAGQYLDGYKRGGFPWIAFEIIESPNAKVFFGLRKLGEPLATIQLRDPLTADQARELGVVGSEYQFLEIDFESLKRIIDRTNIRQQGKSE